MCIYNFMRQGWAQLSHPLTLTPPSQKNIMGLYNFWVQANSAPLSEICILKVKIFNILFSETGLIKTYLHHRSVCIPPKRVFTLSISSPMIKIAAVGAFPLAGEGGLELEWFVDMVASQRWAASLLNLNTGRVSMEKAGLEGENKHLIERFYIWCVKFHWLPIIDLAGN